MERKTEEQYNRGLLEFIQNSPSMFHVADNMKKRLEEAGFVQLREREDWELTPGGAYFVTRNDSSLIAFRLPAAGEAGGSRPFKGYHIVAAHSDSPTFKVKTRPETVAEGCYVRLNVENYGGMILSTWLDRPLSVAGRVAVRRADGGVDMRLVNLDRDLLVIPNLAVHMNRDINKGYGYNPQTDMLPLMGLLSGADEGEETAIQPGQGLSQEGTAFQSGQSLPGEETTSQPGQSLPQEETASQPPQGMLLREIARELGIAPEDILDSDLYLYVRERGRVIGRDGELLLSPKLDDLQCVYAGLESFVSTVPGQYANVLAVFDNEEVGSGTRQGADSTFLEDVLLRIQDRLGYGPSVYRQMVADSFLIWTTPMRCIPPTRRKPIPPTALCWAAAS
ncbi:MAG: M18 family aminopeptidase [Acetatifactor sp.]